MDPLRGKYTYFQKLLHKFKARRDIPFRRQFFIGYDLHGNTYWEFTVDGNMQRLRRKLEPYEPKLFKVDYFSTVPPQWLSWLRRTRNNPPSLQELLDDKLRQDRIKLLAYNADAKWHNEKLRLEQEQQLKLQDELIRSQQESEVFQQSAEALKRAQQQDQEQQQQQQQDQEQPQQQPEASPDPWADADAAKNADPIEQASIKPRNQEPNDPWKQADAAKNADPIEQASIKPRNQEPNDPWKQADEAAKSEESPISSAGIKPRR